MCGAGPIKRVLYRNKYLLHAYFSKRNKLSKDEPDVNHLDIGGGGQRLGHADEEGSQHQQRGQVHCDLSLEEERLEEVGGVDDAEDEYGGQEGGQELIHCLLFHMLACQKYSKNSFVNHMRY